MLVLSRKIGERIRIGDHVTLTVVRIHGDKVRLGIEAPPDVTIHREEVYRRMQASGEVPGPDDGGRAGGPGSGLAADSSLSGGRPGR
jgi:carbon storage regulator